MPNAASIPDENDQPRSVFVSHGVSLLAADDTWPSTIGLRAALGPIGRAARRIVVISAHWQTDSFSITADARLPVVDEGLPTELLGRVGPFVGSPHFARDLAAYLTWLDIPTRLVEGRGLDHGAVIALRFLDPDPTTPIVQISLRRDGDPNAHLALGRALRDVGALVVTSGGAVHNLSSIQRFAPHGTPPPPWAESFRDALDLAICSEEPDIALLALMNTPEFHQAHPTSEHFLPILVNAGLTGSPTLIHDSWQWSSLAMTSYVYSPRTRAGHDDCDRRDSTLKIDRRRSDPSSRPRSA